MKPIIALAPLVLLSLVTVPCAAQTAVPDAAAKPKKVCRLYQSTGSIMPGKRVCHTAQEWTELDAANNDNARRSKDLEGEGGNSPGGQFGPMRGD